MFSRSEVDLNQLSFGMSAGFVQNDLDETKWLLDGQPDPAVFGIIQKASYFNVDLGASYNYLDFYTHFTVKNALASKRLIYTDVESDNLRKLLLSAGYVFGDSERIQFEPSFLFQLVDETKEKTIDLNLKNFYSPVILLISSITFIITCGFLDGFEDMIADNISYWMKQDGNPNEECVPNKDENSGLTHAINILISGVLGICITLIFVIQINPFYGFPAINEQIRKSMQISIEKLMSYIV